MTRLGQIQKIDVREAWVNQTGSFPPWLEEHIRQLAVVLGLDLEVESREAPLGAFSLDLLARGSGPDRESRMTRTALSAKIRLGMRACLATILGDSLADAIVVDIDERAPIAG